MTEMREVERLSLLAFLLGTAAIYASSTYFTPLELKAGEVDESYIGDTIRVTGRVEDVSRSGEEVFFHITGSQGSLDAVSFSRLDVREGEKKTLEGRLNVYRGSLELIVDEVVRRRNRTLQGGT